MLLVVLLVGATLSIDFLEVLTLGVETITAMLPEAAGAGRALVIRVAATRAAVAPTTTTSWSQTRSQAAKRSRTRHRGNQLVRPVTTLRWE